MTAFLPSKTTFNDDYWQNLACSLAPACDDEIFSMVKNEFNGVELYYVQSFRECEQFQQILDFTIRYLSIPIYPQNNQNPLREGTIVDICIHLIFSFKKESDFMQIVSDQKIQKLSNGLSKKLHFINIEWSTGEMVSI